MAQRSDIVQRPWTYSSDGFPYGQMGQLNTPYLVVGHKGLAAASMLGPIIRKIIKEREARGWSRAELGRQARVRQQTVWNVENGQTWPDFVTLAALCDALDLKLSVTAPRPARRAPATSPAVPKG